MMQLLKKIEQLKRGSIGKLVDKKIEEFRQMKEKSSEDWFSEICFCILTANSSAKVGLRIQRELGKEGFLSLPKEELVKKLKMLGHRYYDKRAEYIVEARRFRNIKGIVKRFQKADEAREWLKKNIKGLGYKESSHFLRNVGYIDVAILDRHVLRVMFEHGLIDAYPRSLSRESYFRLERLLKSLAEKSLLTLAELDLYLWYLKTGEILK